MRFLIAIFTLALLVQTPAFAQMPPLTPPPIPDLVTPDAAVSGVLTSVSGDSAVLQTPSGDTVQLALRHGYLLVNPSPQALSSGQRVFAIGFTSGGTVQVDEIDVLFPLNLMSETPIPAQK
jgi:hypothetical protein